MSEWIVVACALAFSVASVWLIHRLVMAHLQIGSSYNKTILSMEIVALGILLAAFVLGEVAKLVGAVTDKFHSTQDVGLTASDSLLVLGCLLASLLIYTVIKKLQ